MHDLLLRLALVDLYRARWTETILDECFRNLTKNRPGLRPDELARTRDLMNAHVLDALITGYETLIPSLVLPDPDDRHVLAAAPSCYWPNQRHCGSSLRLKLYYLDRMRRDLKGLSGLRNPAFENPVEDQFGPRARVTVLHCSVGLIAHLREGGGESVG